MEQSGQTRIELLNLKARHGVALGGVQLMKSKREALMRDFFRLMKDVVDTRSNLTTETEQAANTLFLALGTTGKDALSSAALACKRDISLEIYIKNVWGVNVPEIEEKPMVRSIEARGPSPVGEEFLVNETARCFERVLEAILATAARESRLKRIGEEIYTTTRRVNALEELLIPSLRKRIRNIERSLEEREREEIFRLKRFKMRQGSKTAVKPDPEYFPLGR